VNHEAPGGVQLTANGSVRRSAVTELVLGGVAAAALLYGYRDALAGMVATWSVSRVYSYGFTVPFISLYLLWARRDALSRVSPAPARILGSGVLLLGVAITAAGRGGGIQLLEQLAFLISLAGVVLLLFGTAVLRIGGPALAYLLLMIPLWDGLTDPLHAPFQERSAAIGVAVMQAVGIPASRDGTLIALPTMIIEVGRGCSGVNYLVAVVAFALPLAYLYLPTLWRRAALVVAAVVVAAVSNGLRVALIGILAYRDIGSPLHGPFHVLHGLFVAAAGFVVIFAGLWVLTPRTSVTPPSARRRERSSQAPLRLPRLELLGVVLLLGAMGTGVLARESRPVRLGNGLERLPIRLGQWHGEFNATADGVSPLWPGADMQFRQRYRAAGGAVIDVHLSHFEAQRQSHELVSFRTADLHRRSSPVTLRTPSGFSFGANRVPAGEDPGNLLFWYVVGGVAERGEYEAKLRTLWTALVHARSDGTAIVLSPVNGATSESDLRELAGLVEDSVQERLSPRASSTQ
jgi:EpsI family protein